MTQTQAEWLGICEQSTYISADVLADYEQRFAAEDDLSSFAHGLREFISSECTLCAAAGSYRCGFLGKVDHPACGANWYANPLEYIRYQFKSAMWTGAEMAATERNENEKWVIYLAFFFGALFRLAFSVLLVPVQVGVYMANRPRVEGARKIAQ
jgi:hypothetical protein